MGLGVIGKVDLEAYACEDKNGGNNQKEDQEATKADSIVAAHHCTSFPGGGNQQ